MPQPARSVFYAPGFVMGGMAMVAVSDNFVPLVSDLIGLGQFQAVRCVAALAVVLALAWATGGLGRIRPTNPRGVLVRSLFNVIALMLYFAALPTVPIAQAAAGIFTSPVWVAILSGLFFGAPVGPRRAAGVVVGFAGVLLVLQVGAAEVRPMALLGVAAGFFYALNVIWTRRHCAAETALCIAFWNFVAYFLAGVVFVLAGPLVGGLFVEVPADLVFMLRGWEPMSLATVAITFGIGITAILSSALLAEGYRTGESSVASLFDFSFLLWAPVVAFLLWGQTVTWLQALGMGLIVVAGVLAIWSGKRRSAA